MLLSLLVSNKEEKLKVKCKEYLSKSDFVMVEELFGGKIFEKDYFKEGEWKFSWIYLEFVSMFSWKYMKSFEW